MSQDSWLKIRVRTDELERWKQLAGYRGFSAWVRGALNQEVRRVEGHAANVRRAPSQNAPAINKPEETHKSALPPGRLITEVCRHGLINCRVCQTGAFARDAR